MRSLQQRLVSLAASSGVMRAGSGDERFQAVIEAAKAREAQLKAALSSTLSAVTKRAAAELEVERRAAREAERRAREQASAAIKAAVVKEKARSASEARRSQLKEAAIPVWLRRCPRAHGSSA